MPQKIELHTVRTVMHSIYERVSNGVFFDKKLNVYTKKQLEELLQYFESAEEYDKCTRVLSIINKRQQHQV